VNDEHEKDAHPLTYTSSSQPKTSVTLQHSTLPEEQLAVGASGRIFPLLRDLNGRNELDENQKTIHKNKNIR
jgi:hypothetical protein